MSSRVERIEINLQCVRCLRRIRWAWLITYKSFRYTQLVYVCGKCGSIIKVANASKGRNISDGHSAEKGLFTAANHSTNPAHTSTL
jgi:hypothetical protein